MAENIGSLYVRLGLNLSELETGFVTASQTVAANISRLNRESDLIRIRSQVEIAGLDETTDAERILQIRTNALNQQMAIQRDRVRLLTAEVQSLTAAHGENATVTQRATIRLERERLALAELERELRNVNSTQGETNESFSDLSDLLSNMPPQLQTMAKGFGVIAAGAGAAGAAVNEMLDDFRELQNQSYELNLDFNDAEQFLRELKLAGGDIGDFEGYIRGITDAFVKGEYDDPEFIALRKYGAEITDATGRLKNFAEITEEVYQAWLKADAAGEGIEFLQLTGGEAGVRDAIQYFKRLKEAREDAGKIYDANLDAGELHELDRAMNLVDEQARELKNAIGNIFTPAATAAAENFFEILHSGAEFLVENKDKFQRWGFIAAETFETAGEKIKSAFSFANEKIAENLKLLEGKTGDSRVDETLNQMNWRYGNSVKNPYGVDKMIEGLTTETKKSYGAMNDIVDRAEQKQAEYNAELEETAEKIDEINEKIDNNPLNQYDWKRINAFKEELEDLQTEIDFGDNEYRKALAQLELWANRELTSKNFLSDAEREAIEKLKEAKKELIDQEYADKIAEYWKNAAEIEYEMTHSAFEKELRDIELWQEAQEEKASTAEETAGIIANAAAKEAQAFEREVDRIKGQMQSLDDKIFALDHSQYENDLRRIQQEYLHGLEEAQEAGTLPLMQNKLDYLYQRQKEELDKKAAQDKDYKKSPTADGIQRGGNGIVLIGGDTVIDDGQLQARSKNISLLADENKIREQLLPTLSDCAREFLSAQQAAKDLVDTQKLFEQSQEKAKGGFQLIEGDQVTYTPELPTESLQEFNSALQQTTLELEQAKPAAAISTAENQLAEKLKNVSDGMDNVSTMQLRLTESTMNLIDAQKLYGEALKTAASSDKQGNDTKGGFQQLSYANQRALEPLPTPQQSSSWKIGFDQDTAGLIAGLGSLGLMGAGAAVSPALLALIAGGSLLGGLVKGSIDATTAPQATFGNADLTELITPLTSIDNKFETVVTPLNSIENIVGQILSALSNQEARQVNISPNVDIDLGGAYVFDNQMKMSLVDDITERIVTAITDAVEKATSQRSYGFSV